MKKGDLLYLDGFHKDRLEVFDSNGKFRKVLNLDGTINIDKTAKGMGRKLIYLLLKQIMRLLM